MNLSQKFELSLGSQNRDQLIHQEYEIEKAYVINNTICDGIFMISLVSCICMMLKRGSLRRLPKQLKATLILYLLMVMLQTIHNITMLIQNDWEIDHKCVTW